MLSILEGIEEYNNAGALIGLEGLENEELLGALRKMPFLKRQKVINKLTQPSPPSRGSRAEMEKHFNELPAHIRSGLSQSELRLADAIIYSIKPVSSKTVKMFETQDVKEIGLRNISNAKLQKNQSLLVSGIILLAGTSVDSTQDNVMATDFQGLENFPTIANGEFSFKSNKKQLVPETSNRIFCTEGLNTVPLGYYKLANPRLIQDDVLIEVTIEVGTMTGIAANTHIFCGLHGTITTP